MVEEDEEEEEDVEETPQQSPEKPKGMFMFAKVKAGQEVEVKDNSESTAGKESKMRPQSGKPRQQRVNF